MFFFHNGRVAVLLLVLILNLVQAFSNDDKNKIEGLAKSIISSMQIPWINGIDSLTRASDGSCADETAAVLAALAAQQTWALQMLDASSKIQSGILKGNIKDLGMYDQCLGVDGEYNETSVRGQHCAISYSGLSSSVCVPSSCNETEVGDLVTSVVQNLTGGIALEFTVSCVEELSETFTTGEILTIVFFATVGAFIITCTICDFVKRSRSRESSATVNMLAEFSLYKNAMNILSTKVSPNMMPAIQGIRFLSIAWIVYGHSMYNVFLMPLVNSVDIVTWYNSWPAVYMQTAPFAVDTFFVVSGFLMTYLFLKSKQSGKRSNFPMMYLHRYLRLTPALAVVILFVAVLLHRVTNGPVWNTVLRSYVSNCQKNWWVNLLYIQNYVNPKTMCLGQTWYLAVDMHLFLISPIILYPLSRWPKIGFSVLSLFLIASVVTPPVLLAINDFSTAVFRFDVATADRMNDFLYFYIPTQNRACAYFVGMLLGCDVANKKRNLTQTNVTINWIVACIFLLACAPATHYSYSSNFEYNKTVEIVFATLLRPLWSIAIAWMIYACTQGYGGILTRFLSLPLFLPLSRLSYCLYLVHMVIQASKTSAVQVPNRFSDFGMLNTYWADLGLSIAVAFILSLFFESPVVILEKILKNRGRGGKRLPRNQELKTDEEVGIDNKGLTVT